MGRNDREGDFRAEDILINDLWSFKWTTLNDSGDSHVQEIKQKTEDHE